MSLSGDFSSGTPGSVPPASTPPQTTAAPGGRPKWLIPVIIGVVACCLLGAVALCVLPNMFASQLGPFVLSAVCTTENPNASAEACSAWATDVMTNHPDAFVSCQQASPGNTSALYQCLLDAGVSPP
jgi:hypothetical protein